jgi:hypothetical protein
MHPITLLLLHPKNQAQTVKSALIVMPPQVIRGTRTHTLHQEIHSATAVNQKSLALQRRRQRA